MITEQQFYEVVRAIEQWAWLRSSKGETINWHADVSHSALLRRMLVDGKAPLPEPPPRAFSYPWYDLIEEGGAEHVNAWIHYEPIQLLGEPGANIEQMIWKIVKKISDTECIVTYDGGKTNWRLWLAEPERNEWGYALERIKNEQE